ncbi:chloride channel protein [Fischerella thermalis]|jgi:CIC family chloride channel protein|uniref:Cl-channel voltage-gated family protein n=7 Tax=Fischerella TaxID=1190 RepID=G6FNC6_9CYAN|nr:chloride channel protein [Fischerella thermalis]EHC19556.1 Cl- channel voltage-gated family protein [Fischerella thermalis JSC-11]PLZ06491.1 chloride channel protein [Fischerella thermalis WC119]PLZ09102.1 chloride channel protein [Fischerella thermalis WC114]PLZ09448.1 chloride channel protein [Fischerella thermalis WC1110]PLZ18703.1 chloride channel protein [Fischerella thermalis WC157]
MSLPFLNQYIRTVWQPRRGLAIAEACIIGLVAAFSAVCLKFGSGWLGTWRVQGSQVLPAWLFLPAVGLGFGFLAGLLVQRLAPEASGSGIPHVKASLANVPVKLSWRVAIVKLLSAMITLASGITLGRQGPTVQVGAALAAGMSRWVPTSPDHRRQMIAAGAGAGLAAAFNAPIAGVLFVVEELLQDLSGLTLGTAIIASFIGGVVSRLLGGRSLLLNLELTQSSSSFSIIEIPFYLVLGVLAGLLAALFNRGLIESIKTYRRLHVSLPLRVALAGFISGIVVAFLPPAFRDNTGLREFVIAGQANAPIAAIAFLAQFLLTLVAFGSGAPGGLFAPSLILGSCLGYIVGIVEFQLLGLASPTTYALAGMGAFFSAVSKVPITAIVIVFEMTTDFNLVLPLMIGSVTSYLVADKLMTGSLYTKLLHLSGINLENVPPVEGAFTKLTAKDVMQRRVETLDAEMSVEEVVQAFSRSHHRGFPVVEQGKLVGIVTQTDLLKIRDRNLAKDTPLREIMTPQPVTVTPTHNLSNVLYLLDRHQISRLPVVEGQRIIGIITRADIIRAEADSLNCHTREHGPQPEPSYVVYQTRSPSIGRGRLLVPVANPETAATLLQMAAAIARDRHYEIECLQVILVSRQKSPAETPVRTAKSRRLLRNAEVLGKKWKIPVHTQIRVTHDIAHAILETIKERHIDLILMGWKGSTSTPGRIFGDVVDTVIRQATCEMVLVKLGKTPESIINHQRPFLTHLFPIPPLSHAPSHYLPIAPSPHLPLPPPQFNSWLVPMAGGPNARAAIKLLPALVTLGNDPKIRLTRVFKPSESEPDMKILEEAIRILVRRQKSSSTVVAAPVQADSVTEGVINLVNTEHYDVVVLGASREGMLQQAIKGNIPEAIASGVDSTVILVRGAINN